MSDLTFLLILILFGLLAGCLWALDASLPYRIERDDHEIRDLWAGWRRRR